MFENVNTAAEFLLLWIDKKPLKKEEQKIFDAYYRGYINKFPKRMQYFYNKQLESTLSLLKEMKNPKVLEIGCGLGSESLFMALQGAEVLGIDIDDKRLNVARERQHIVEKDLDQTLKCDFKNISVLDLSDDKKFDLIWIEQAYHHLEPREPISEHISKLLAPNGYLVISEANAWNPLNQLVLFKQRGFDTISYHIDGNGIRRPYGNERILTPYSLVKNFQKNKINKLRIEYFRLFPNKKLFDNLLNFEIKFPKFFIPFFTHYNYIGKKIK